MKDFRIDMLEMKTFYRLVMEGPIDMPGMKAFLGVLMEGCPTNVLEMKTFFSLVMEDFTIPTVEYLNEALAHPFKERAHTLAVTAILALVITSIKRVGGPHAIAVQVQIAIGAKGTEGHQAVIVQGETEGHHATAIQVQALEQRQGLTV